ncbi:MAG: L-threonylcarbamoyladenylate synthase [Bacillota bacterium]
MTKTRIYRVDELDKPSAQTDIKKTLQQGKNVVFPTETVYGIGANALSKEGIENIYKIKGRPSDNPLIMHLANADDLDKYVYVNQPYIKKLIHAFWPGPLTMVFEKKTSVPDYFTGGLKTVGVRIPGSAIARKIIEIADVPICAPSANISGRPSSTLFKHVIEDFNQKADILIDGGKSEVGLESTVLDVTKPVPVILRPGMITYDMIKTITGSVHISSDTLDDDIPKSPGMKYKHYAPKGQLIIVEGDIDKVIEYINKHTVAHQKSGYKTGVITTSEYKDQFTSSYIYNIGWSTNESEIASNIFAALRDMDEKDIEFIYTLSFRNGQYSDAIMNRLIKAANKHIINV